MIVTGSKELMRDINTQLVLRTVMEEGPLSRAALSSKLGLTKATISAIVQILLEKHLLLEIGSDDTSRGRKPILLQLNRTCAYCLAIDLSAEYITAFTADLTGAHCTLERIPNLYGRDRILPALFDLVRRMRGRLPQSVYGLIGICIGIHGVVHKNRPVFVPYAPYQDLDLASALEEQFSVPVLVENEANLSALGEWSFCRFEGLRPDLAVKNLLFLSVHSGIGLGIIMDGRLITGQDGYAGEFGHSIISVGGRPCPCGNRGCLEQYASERALLGELSQRKGYTVSADHFARLYARQDADACRTLAHFVSYMAVAVSNLLTIFNPEIIVLNSSFTMHVPGTASLIRSRITNRMTPYCRLTPSRLQDTAILLGGVYLSSRKFLGLEDPLSPSFSSGSPSLP